MRLALGAVALAGFPAIVWSAPPLAGLPREFDALDGAPAPQSTSGQPIDGRANGQLGRVIARLRIDGTGHIDVVRATTPWRERLTEIAHDLNQLDSILLREPPPASAPDFSIYGVPIGRDDPRFLTALRAYLWRHHGLELR